MNAESRAQQKKAYRVWAPVYDNIYKGFLDRAQRELAHRAGQCGRDILEVGVGTGLVLPHYPRESAVTGIDISEEMLAKAKAKRNRGDFPHVRDLKVMDACHLQFDDASFDAVTLPFVITLVPDTEQLLSECARVLRPGGQIVIVSKISNGGGLSGLVEDAVSPFAERVGLSTAYRLEKIDAWINGRDRGFRLIENRAIPPFGFFKLLRLKQTFE